jgi:predicted PurR-regulated permease PerM
VGRNSCSGSDRERRVGLTRALAGRSVTTARPATRAPTEAPIANPMPISPLQWTILGLTAASLYVCWPLWPALVLAAWTAALARPLLERFERALHRRRRAAGVLSLLLFLVLALPIVAVVLGVVSGAQELVQLVTRQSSAKSVLVSVAVGTGPAPELPKNLASAIDLVQHYGAQGASVLQDLVGAAANGLIALLIFFGGAHEFLLDGSRIWSWVKRHSPLGPAHLERFAAAFHETGRGLLVGVGLTSATQGLVAMLVYLSLGVPRWWVLGPITGLASMIPLVGSALVWAPIAIGLFLTDHTVKGLILVLLGIGVISTVDNVLRPVFSRVGSLEMPTFLLFVALFGGILAFGTWGAILGPLVVRMWLEALAIRGEATHVSEPS